MITISNRWISNSISYAEVVKIANLGHQHAYERSMRHCPKMDLAEKIYDYVFCGSVKQQFMERLYKMSGARRRSTQISDHCCIQSPEDLQRAKNQYQVEMHWHSDKLSRLLSGATLKFATNPIQTAAYMDSYLIYRDHTRRNAIGIRMQARCQTISDSRTLADAPAFNSLAQIQLKDLDIIRKNKSLYFGGQLYEVRFTKKNGPVIIYAEGLAHRYVVQKRLLSLWAIAKVKERLAGFRSNPSAITVLNRTYPESGRSAEYLSFRFLTSWLQFVGPVQNKFAKSVGLVNQKLDLESRVIEDGLACFENLTNPSREQKQSFLQLQERITLLEDRRRTIEEHLKETGSIVDYLSSDVSDGDAPSIMEAYRNRMLNFIDQMCLFTLSNMNDDKIRRFHHLCLVQRELFNTIKTIQLGEVITPQKIQSWSYPIHPPVLQTETRLLNLVQNPAITADQIRAAMPTLSAEQDAAIDLRIRQIEMGQETITRMRTFLNNPIIASQPHSTTLRRLFRVLGKISARLLTPGNNFSHAELDAWLAKKEHYFKGVSAERDKLYDERDRRLAGHVNVATS